MTGFQQVRMTGRRAALVSAALFALLYAASFVYWTRVVGGDGAETLFLSGLLGVAFPAIALLLTLRLEPLGQRIAHRPGALPALLLCLVPVCLFFALGSKGVFERIYPAAALEPLAGWASLALKLTIFALIPLAVFGWFLREPAGSFGWRPISRMLAPRQLLIILVFAALFTAVQLFAGREGPKILSGGYPLSFLLAGASLSFLWLAVEAGVVEEVFFRAVLQERLAAAMQSDVGGLLIASLVFGLAHAPGLFLRGEFGELGPLASAAYCVLTLAPSGLVFGVLWMRTRNLLALILIHGSVDAIPNMVETAARFGFAPGG